MTRFDIWLAGAWITTTLLFGAFIADHPELKKGKPPSLLGEFLTALAVSSCWPLLWCALIGGKIRQIMLRWRARNLRA